MQPSEKMVKSKIKKILDLYALYNPMYILNPMTFGYGESGHPDILVLVNHNLIGIEAKKDINNHHCRPELKAKPNEVMQKRQAEKIRTAGGRWICIHNDNLHALVELLDTVAQKGCVNFSEEDFKTIHKIMGTF